jgi:hypothetical protein
MRHLLLLFLLAQLSAADVNLVVNGVTGGGTKSYAWSVVARPYGAVIPTFAARTTATNSNKLTFLTDSRKVIPGTYLIQVGITVGSAPPVNVQTEVQVTRGQTTTFPAGGETIIYNPSFPVGFDPGATTTAANLGVVYSIVSGTAATIIGNIVCPVGTGTVVVRADIAPHTPVRYRSRITPMLKTYQIVPPSPQVISVAASSVTLVQGPTPRTASLGATTTSGLPLAYVSSAPAVATVSPSGIVTAVSLGTAIITISQPGNVTTAAASPVSVDIQVVATGITLDSPLTATPARLDLP